MAREGDPVAVFVTVRAAVAAVAEVIVGEVVLTTFPAPVDPSQE